MSGAAVRRVIVLTDEDLVSTLSADEATLDDLLDYADSDGIVCYELMVAIEVDIGAVLTALDVAPTGEHDIADADGVALLWDEETVERAVDVLREKLEDPRALAEALCRFVVSDLGAEDPGDVDEVVEVLEEADRGYQPGPTAHLSLLVAAALMRHVLAFGAAARREACVISM